MAYTYAIADLHGRADLLAAAVDLAEDHAGPAGGTLVVLGDMIDRGPDSAAVIDRLMAGPPLPGWQWVVLKGNHEAMLLRGRDGSLPLRVWIAAGGGATLFSYGYRDVAAVDFARAPLADHVTWLDALPMLHADRFRVFVHAGVDTDVPLAAQDERTLLWKLHRGDDAAGYGERHLVHGHQPDAAGPRLLDGRTGLDTHAWFSGRLAVGVFDDDLPGGPVDILWADLRYAA